jgi:hypothetical protein
MIAELAELRTWLRVGLGLAVGLGEGLGFGDGLGYTFLGLGDTFQG